MGIMIDGDEAQNLAWQLSELTGETVAVAVTEAIRERLERVRNAREPGLADRLVRLGKDCAAHMKEPYLSMDHGDMLYDERGLPREND